MSRWRFSQNILQRKYSKMQPMIRMGTKLKGHKICNLHGSYGL